MSRTDEAARWFATLRRGVMTLDERRAYGVWLAETGNRDAMTAMENLWRMLDGAPPASLPERTRRIVFAAICACSLAMGILSSVSGGQFWTVLDWTSR